MATAKRNAIIETTTINPSRLKQAISHSINRKRPLFVWGPPGIGKSDIVASVAAEQGRPLIDIRLPLMEPTDVRGIPYLADVKIYDKEGNLVKDEQGVALTEKVFTWSNPSDLPTDPNSRALVFFDEMSAAPPSVQAATYQIILNRKIGNYKLPDDVVIVAAGNRVKDKGVAYNMPMPLANRFTHVTLGVDVDDWKEWALLNRVHKDIVGYLSFQPNDLNNFNPSSDSYAFATPRSWYFASELIQEMGKDGTLVDTTLQDEVLGDLIKGTIGEGPGIKFMTYRKQAANLPNARDILEGKVTKLNSKQIDIMYALTTALCYELVDSERRAQIAAKNGDNKPGDVFHEQCDRFFRFIMDNFEDELAVMGAKIILGTHKLQIKAPKLKNWKEFCDRYADLIPNV
jgi:hypothetical protein